MEMDTDSPVFVGVNLLARWTGYDGGFWPCYHRSACRERSTPSYSCRDRFKCHKMRVGLLHARTVQFACDAVMRMRNQILVVKTRVRMLCQRELCAARDRANLRFD